MTLPNLNKNDWIGLGATIGVHGLLALLFSLLTMAPAEPVQLGYVDVTFGPMAEARPTPQEQETQQANTPEPTPPTTEDETEPAPPQTEQPETQPVDVPEENVTEEEQVTQPEEGPPSEGEAADNAPEEQTDAPTIAASDASDSTQVEGEEQDAVSETGTGEEEQTTAPFEIEGLNRVTLSSPLPRYAANVNATIKVRITVNPQGRIIQRIPLIKGNPDLEAAVMDALGQWRFNALPPNAPQSNQTGTITFRFRLQ